MPRLSFVAMSRDGLRAHRETKIGAVGSGLIVEESARLTFPNRSAIPKGVRRAAMGSPYPGPGRSSTKISTAECVQNCTVFPAWVTVSFCDETERPDTRTGRLRPLCYVRCRFGAALFAVFR